MPTTRLFSGFVLIASGLVLGTVLASQYWGGLAPCELCLLQRWPWDIAITIAIIALLVGDRAALPWVGGVLALVFAVSVAFGIYHVGVEQHWFAGPSTCTAGASGAETVEQMKARILGHAPVMCDSIPWSFHGISLAGLNVIASLVMTLLCVVVALRPRAASRRAGLRESLL